MKANLENQSLIRYRVADMYVSFEIYPVINKEYADEIENLLHEDDGIGLGKYEVHTNIDGKICSISYHTIESEEFDPEFIDELQECVDLVLRSFAAKQNKSLIEK
jgi:hypothetical protein